MTIPAAPTFAPPVASAPPSAPLWENWAVRLLLALYVALQLNNIYHKVYAGQDYGTHTAILDQLLNDTEGHWFFMDGTNRPAVYWIGGLCKRFTRELYTMQLTTMIWVAIGVPALLLLHRSLLTAIRSPELRLAVMTLVTLLPANVIAGVVFAGDVGVYLPFALAAWALLRSLDAPHLRSALGYAALTGVALALGDFIKVTFLLLPVAVLVSVVLTWRWGRIGARRAGLTLLLATALPLAVGGALQWKNTRDLATTETRHVFNWSGTGEMTWRSLLGLKATDARVLHAPTFWDKDAQDQLFMIQENGYSYPALVHLGVFTDVLNYAQDGGAYNCTVPRAETQQHYAVLSVRAGLLWSAISLVAVAALALLILVSLWRPSLAPPTGLLVWATQGAVWYFPLMLILPYIRSAYSWGYFLPRLFVPALWSAALIAGWFLDRVLPARSRWWTRAVLAFALLQSWWHLRSLWC